MMSPGSTLMRLFSFSVLISWNVIVAVVGVGVLNMFFPCSLLGVGSYHLLL